MDDYTRSRLDQLAERLRALEVTSAEIVRELVHRTEQLDEFRQSVRSILLRVNAMFLTALITVIGALVSLL